MKLCKRPFSILTLILLATLMICQCLYGDLPLYWWKPYRKTNFGDELSYAVIERIVGRPLERAQQTDQHKLLSLGSILQFAKPGDVVWGSGMNGKDIVGKSYAFYPLDVRAVRGPLTHQFLSNFGIGYPTIYGDPALLLPKLFPEFQVSPKKSTDLLSSPTSVK